MSPRADAGVDVSVVIPTYNGAQFIAGALASVLRQTVLPKEVIVVDDASRDETTMLVRKTASATRVPIRLIERQQNAGGPALPLNEGIAAASSSLIAILEQDDLMAADRLRLQSRAAARHPECGMVVGRPSIVVDDASGARWEPMLPLPDAVSELREHVDDESFVVPGAVAFRALMQGNFIYTNSNVLFRKAYFERLGGFDPRWRINSDADFEFRMLAAAPLALVNAAVCGYRSRADSLYHARYAQGRLDGLLIRLEWGERRWEWASVEAKQVYWTLRADLRGLLRSGELAAAFRVAKALVASPILRRHLFSKTGLKDF